MIADSDLIIVLDLLADKWRTEGRLPETFRFNGADHDTIVVLRKAANLDVILAPGRTCSALGLPADSALSTAARVLLEHLRFDVETREVSNAARGLDHSLDTFFQVPR